jgi:hypothetical protein
MTRVTRKVLFWGICTRLWRELRKLQRYVTATRVLTFKVHQWKSEWLDPKRSCCQGVVR